MNTELIAKNVSSRNYLDVINKSSEKEVFALALSKMDKVIGSPGGDFMKWQKQGWSSSKRAARVFHDVVSKMRSPEAKRILEAKQHYMYSRCKGSNIAGANTYKANRVAFLKQASAVLKSM